MADTDALILSLSADVHLMEKQLLRAVQVLDGSANAMEKRARKMEEGVGASFNAILGAGKRQAIEQGAESLGVFGAGLEKLGVGGIAAGAGIAAFTVAMDKTKEAVEYGASIATLAKTLGVSTDFVQQFNFAAKQSEIDVGKADESLKTLNETLGAVQANLPRAKQLLTTFGALGFTREDLAKFHDAGDLLPVLADRISKVADASERAAIAKKLGIADLIPLLNQGADGFNALAQKAKDLGIVMDESTIQKSEEAKKKLSELDDVMRNKAAVGFAQFAGTLLSVKSAFNQAELAALSFLAQVTNTQGPQQKLDALNTQLKNLKAGASSSNNTARIAQVEGEIAGLKKEMSAAADLPKVGGNKPPAPVLVPPKTGGRARAAHDPRDDTDAQIREIDRALAEAKRGELEAQHALTTDIVTKAQDEKAVIDAERDIRIAELEAKKKALLADKGIDGAVSDRLQAEIDQAEAVVKRTAEVKKQNVDRQSKDQIEKALKDAQNEYDRQIAEEKRKQLEAERKKREDNPLYAYGNPEPGQSAKDWQDLQVKGLNGVVDGLTSAVMHTKTLKQAFHDLALSVIEDLVRISIEQTLIKPLAAGLYGAEGGGGILGAAASIGHILGFASGTDFAPGGTALVGENGPELVNLPRGSQVVPNNILKSMGGASGGGNISHSWTVHVHAEGAATMDQVRAIVDGSMRQAVGTATALSVQASRRVVMNDVAQRSRNAIR